MSAGGGGDGGVSGDLEKEALRLQKLLALREEAARAHGAESPQCRNVARRYLQQREFVRTLLQKGRPIPVRTHAHGLRVAVAGQLLPGGQHRHRPYRYVWPRQHGFIADPLCAGPLSHVLCALLAAGNCPLATASAMGGPGYPY